MMRLGTKQQIAGRTPWMGLLCIAAASCSDAAKPDPSTNSQHDSESPVAANDANPFDETTDVSDAASDASLSEEEASNITNADRTEDSESQDSDAGSEAGDATRCVVGAIANSICDYSGTQGKAGWQYGYVAPATDMTFRLMTRYGDSHADADDPKQTWSTGTNVWTAITAETAEPNGTKTSAARDPVEQWAVRRWTSSVAGAISISVTAYRFQSMPDGNGADARLVVDGQTIWSKYISTTDTAPFTQTVPANVNVGSTVDLVLDPHLSDDYFDQTNFSVVIQR